MLLPALVLALGMPPAGAAPAPPPGDAVVAIVDSGINPYHAAFRDRSARARQYPGTYLPGYPKGAIALHLTLDAPDYWDAVNADCQRVWSTVRPGRLYWFPGTTIVGAVSFDLSFPGIDCGLDRPEGAPILDEDGHGTMTASRAAGARHGACPRCRVVSVQVRLSFPVADPLAGSVAVETDVIEALRWTGSHAGWIDAQSNSWGPVHVWDPTGTIGVLGTSPRLVRTVEQAARAHPAFWASGNGIVIGEPTLAAPHFTPSTLIVGGHDSGQVQTWPGFTPHVVSDACDSWAAEHRSVDGEGERVGGGTSAATPYTAGIAVAELAHARRLLGDRRTGVRDGVVARGPAGRVRAGPLADGVLTVAEWRDVLIRTATARPAAQPDDGPPCTDVTVVPLPVRWTDVPAAAPAYPLIGYGAVDRPAQAVAQRVLAGAAPLPERRDEDRYFEAYRTAQEAEYEVFSKP